MPIESDHNSTRSTTEENSVVPNPVATTTESNDELTASHEPQVETTNLDTLEVSRVESRWLHWSLLIVCSTIILLSILMVTPDDQQVTFNGSPLPELCTFKRIFLIGCPGCGMTRAFICISNGNWIRAWLLNPASFMMYALVAFQIPYRIIQLFRLRSGARPFADRWFAWYFLVMAILLVGQWIVRLMAGLVS